MKLATVTSILTLASSTIAVSVTQIMKSGNANDLEIQTDGTCIDLFQGTYGARLNGGVEGTSCLFWVDSGCSGEPIGEINTASPEADLPEGANGIECVVPGKD